jgi:hypothetical protein
MKKFETFPTREQMVEHIWGISAQNQICSKVLKATIVSAGFAEIKDSQRVFTPSEMANFCKTVIELSWKAGFSDGLLAMESGAIQCHKLSGN